MDKPKAICPLCGGNNTRELCILESRLYEDGFVPYASHTCEDCKKWFDEDAKPPATTEPDEPHVTRGP